MYKLLTSISIWLASSTLAFAATQGSQPPPPSPLSQGLFLGGLILISYFLLIRPQSKRAKQHKDLISSIAKGDEVVTNGGLLGQVSRIKDNFIVVKLSEGVEVTLQKNAIAMSLPKGTLKSI